MDTYKELKANRMKKKKANKGTHSRVLQKEVGEWLNIGKGWTPHEMCTLFNVDMEDLTSPKRHRHFVTARMFIFADMYTKGNSLYKIGLAFNRDHATVLHNINELKALISIKDKGIMSYLSDLRRGGSYDNRISQDEWEELEHVL